MKTLILLALAVVVPAVAQGDVLKLNYAYNGAICAAGNTVTTDADLDGSKVLLPVSPYVEQ